MSAVPASRARSFGLILGLAFVLLPICSFRAAADWIDLGGDPLSVTVLEADDQRTLIELKVGGFEADPVVIDGRTYFRILLPDAPDPHEKGLPALPNVRRSVIIPDDRQMRVNVVSSEFVDFPEMPVAPSKGHISRSIDPLTVPYTFDAFYTSGGTYPAALAEAGEPYILRDLRGMVVDANVFQYLAGEATLRVYTRMVIEVVAGGLDTFNVIDRAAPPAKMDPQFARLYSDHFIDYALRGPRYAPVLEDGGLLIITYDAFRPYVEPLYEWKLQKGIPTKLVNLSQIGATSTAIQSYILNEYNTWDLAYVLLVGDAAQIPTISYGNGSDPSYALVAGSDNYPDLFIGRFSAENQSHVETQVERTIAYERDTAEGALWPQSGTGIGSSGGPGDDNEMDWEHEDNIRTDLLNYGYLAVDRIYDPGASAAQVSAALNAGRGIVNYTGHGSTTAWSTSGFSSTHVAALTNDLMLPFICSVACVNGNFVSNTCFAEAWLRSMHDGVPIGAIATYMSTINQDWDPPMAMQDEAVDLLVADAMRTVGGLWFNGSCLMMDEYGTAGVNEFKCWTIFGDPSVAVRTKGAETMLVDHTGVLLLGNDEYDVSVTGLPGALCALYAGGVLYGSALTDATGGATITLDPMPTEPLTLTLTVTAYNKVTYSGTVEAVPASGPYLLVEDTFFVDGSGDGVLNAGESVQLSIELHNSGIATAAAVIGQLSSPSEYVTLTVADRPFGNIPAGADEWGHGAYVLEISPNCPDQLLVTLPLLITGEELRGERLAWEDQISFIVQAPQIAVETVWVDDSEGGNGNNRLDPGESAQIGITLANTGHYGLTGITGVISSNHPLVTISSASGSLAELSFPTTGQLSPLYSLSLDPDYAQPFLFLPLDLTAASGYDQTFDLVLPIGGFLEAFEDGAGDWTHQVVGSGWVDQWHLSSQRNHSPGGGQSWKCGDTGVEDYANLLNAALLSVPLELSGGDSELRFWMWIEAETSPLYTGKAYDGGILEMSVDGGAFTRVTPVGGYPYTIRAGSNPGPFPADTPVFSGAYDWQQVTFDLTGVSGTATFRFRFGSDGAVVKEGWYIDDVELWTGMSPSSTREVELTPVRLALSQSRPNPFRLDAQIAFGLPQAGEVTLEIFDAGGRLVRSLLDGKLPAGFHTAAWDGRDGRGRQAASGIYFYRLSTPDGSLRRSMVLSR